ncbi:Tripartite motif-containing protein 4 [Myotis brandtii]|uniref:Tripartite motif-containing protein 4 n=1 Tax=Myotis brandtii TaxID=109478 RepID=S7PDC0_MYOBR|nr:Tripartite motif-containing protein 4 [Myotis brandtii]
MKKVMHLQDMGVKGATSGRTRQKIRLRLSAEVAKLHHFLAEEEKLFLQRFSKEEETKKKQTENTLKLHQIITSLRKLILEVGEMSQSPILELLWNPEDLLTRSENRDRNYSLEVLKVKTVCHDDEGNAEVIPSGYQFS